MATPRVAFVPLIILLLGLGFKAKVAIVFLGAVIPILVNTYSGVVNCDPELIEMARSVGSSRTRIFFSILLPGAASSIAVGLRLGAAIGLINTIVAELYTALSGLGGLLTIYGNTFQMAPYFVVVLVLAAIGMMTMQALKLLERRAGRWRDGSG
jgi:NitT/TauT family transport system permease protein